MTLDEAMKRYPGARTFTCGDEPDLCAFLTGLMIEGRKTATVTPVRDIEKGLEAMPEVGRCDIALNWDGTPALVIETLSVDMCPYDEVTEDFALAEGENDDLKGWRRDHRTWLERSGGFDPKMMLVCERFRVVEVFGLSSSKAAS